mmetsp:Transcript_83511/g.236935  ORF Transcript_83511/g.236935 Transcript_83511/m.236935 type:complete len:269 (-) Transcript_83511:327-1133(-)
MSSSSSPARGPWRRRCRTAPSGFPASASPHVRSLAVSCDLWRSPKKGWQFALVAGRSDSDAEVVGLAVWTWRRSAGSNQEFRSAGRDVRTWRCVRGRLRAPRARSMTSSSSAGSPGGRPCAPTPAAAARASPSASNGWATFSGSKGSTASDDVPGLGLPGPEMSRSEAEAELRNASRSALPPPPRVARPTATSSRTSSCGRSSHTRARVNEGLWHSGFPASVSSRREAHIQRDPISSRSLTPLPSRSRTSSASWPSSGDSSNTSLKER